MRSIIDDWGPGRQIDPGGISVVSRGGIEVGIVFAEAPATTEQSGGYTWSVVTEHWYFYPGWTAPSRALPSLTLTWKDPIEVSGSDVVTPMNIETYVRSHSGQSLAGVTYERCTSRRRKM